MRYKTLGLREQGTLNWEQGTGNRKEEKQLYLITSETAVSILANQKKNYDKYRF